MSATFSNVSVSFQNQIFNLGTHEEFAEKVTDLIQGRSFSLIDADLDLSCMQYIFWKYIPTCCRFIFSSREYDLRNYNILNLVKLNENDPLIERVDRAKEILYNELTEDGLEFEYDHELQVLVINN